MKSDNLVALAKKISTLDYYVPLFANAFGAATIDSTKIRAAISEFINNFNFSNNKFSRSLHGQEQLTASEATGHNIFFGKGRCSNRHQHQ